jgi:hypothetical protein
LALSYSTGNGNGLFGMGWALSLPEVARKVSRHVDGPGGVFVVSGAEELVPIEGPASGRIRFRSRTDEVFEHICDGSGDYWEARGEDGIRTRYGTARPPGMPRGWRDPAVIADPDDPRRIFGWRITETRDLLGNLVRYEYVADQGHQPVISRISYRGHGDPSFPVDIEFDYEPRSDPYADWRAGFEVRTTLRCTALRVVVHTADGGRRVAREMRFTYLDAPFTGVCLLAGVDVGGSPAEPGPGRGNPGARPAGSAGGWGRARPGRHQDSDASGAADRERGPGDDRRRAGRGAVGE